MDEQITYQALAQKVSDLSDAIDALNYNSWRKSGPGSAGISGSLIESLNFKTGVSGWQLTPDGNLEANAGTFRGALQANSLDIPDTTTANSFHVNTAGDTWWGATTFGAAVASISKAGAAIFSSVVATGTINATGGYLGAPTTVLNISTSGLDVGVTGHIAGGATDYLTGTGFFLGYSGAAYKFSVGNPAGNYIGWDGTTLTIIGNQVDVQTFNANGTWTKPTGAKSVVVQAWGGGGGGGTATDTGLNSAASGGGGGAYNTFTFNASDLSATVAVTVPAAAGVAAAGGTVTFGAYVSAFGGGAGVSSGAGVIVGGGGGGGLTAVGSAGTTTVGGAGGAPVGGAGGTDPGGTGGVNGAFGGSGGGGRAGGSGGASIYGGSGGGGGSNNGSGAGGAVVYGAGGGGGGSYGTQSAPGGVSVFGGAGGAGGFNANGSNGVAPGGGGGGGGFVGTGSKTGGSGAAGRIVVTSYL